MHLRRGQPDAWRVMHRLEHVGDEAADLWRSGIPNRFAHLQQHGVAHARDLQYGHATSEACPRG